MSKFCLGCVITSGAITFGFYQQYIVPDFPLDLSGGSVLITGVSSGIGLDAAITIARRNITVFAGVREKQDAVEVARLGHGRVVPVILDVRNETHLHDAFIFVDKFCEEHGEALWAIVNNAGVACEQGQPWYQQIDVIQRCNDVNVIGALKVSSTFIPLLLDAKEKFGSARIVNIGSTAGLVGKAGSLAYVISKFALEGASDVLRRELREYGVAVSMVNPALVKSRLTQNMHNSSSMASANITTSPAIVDAIFNRHPRTRYYPADYYGLPAWFIAILAKLPDYLVDAILDFVVRTLG